MQQATGADIPANEFLHAHTNMTRQTYPSRDDENLSSADAGSPSRTVLKLHTHIQESYIVTHFV